MTDRQIGAEVIVGLLGGAMTFIIVIIVWGLVC